jgi:phospholipase C
VSARSTSEVSRRDVLQGSLGFAGLLAAGPWLQRGSERLRAPASASESAALRALGRTTMRLAGSLPDPTKPAGVDTLPGIEHIVVLMMENHSYDNLLGMLHRGDGFRLDHRGQPTATNPYPDGRRQHAFRMPTTCQLPGTPSQEWTASHVAWNNGRMNGFVRAPIDSQTSEIVGGVAMGYWTADDIPFTYGLAKTFAVGDRWFSSTLCQTDPNRRYLIAGTSAGMTGDVGTGPGNGLPDGGLTEPGNGTIFQQFAVHGISWVNYAQSYPTGATPELFPGDDAGLEATNHLPFEQFFSDARAGKLPSYTLLDPNYGTQSQENPQDIVVGEAMMRRVVEALGESPVWRKTLLVVMYDEHGGYYDHVPPPPALPPDDVPPTLQPGEKPYDGFARYGIRVPALVISPYSRPGHVTHRLHDHTSVLAMVERKWNLPALTKRDANAHDLLGFLDVGAMKRNRPTFPELPPLPRAGDSKAALRCATTGPGQIPPPGTISPPRH